MRVVISVLLVLVASVIGAAAADQPRVTIDVRDADAKEAIAMMFYKSGENFVIDSSVTGKVTAKIDDQPLDVALRAVLTTIDATWRKRDGIYEIVKKTPPPTPVNDISSYSGDANPMTPVFQTSDDVILEKVPLNFLNAPELLSTLKGESSPTTPLPAPLSGPSPTVQPFGQLNPFAMH